MATIDMDDTYWFENGKHQAEYERLFETLVPEVNNCKTVEGEFLRAIAKVYYDYYNNGFCNNMTGPLRFLLRYLSINDQKVKEDLEFIFGAHTHMITCRENDYVEPDFDEQLEGIVNYIIEYIIDKESTIGLTDNVDHLDMWDYQILTHYC